MAKIKIPYSNRLLEVEIPDHNLVGILESKAHTFHAYGSQEEIVNRALDHPIGSATLEELVLGRKNMVIITSDHTRPVPSKVTMPILLKRIRKVNPDIDIKILIATGFHRPDTTEELIHKFGKEIVDHEVIINHLSEDENSVVRVGTLPSGGELWLNKLAMETELLISEGFIEPHFLQDFPEEERAYFQGWHRRKP